MDDEKQVKNTFNGTGRSSYNPVRKVKVWFAGLWFAVTTEVTVAYKVALSAIALVFCVILHEWVHFLLIFLATSLTLMAELFNSAIEGICDYIQPERDEKIRVIKDIAAAAVGVSVITWLVVLIIWIDRVILKHFFF